MKFKIQRRKKRHLTVRHRHKELALAEKFGDAVVKEFGDKIKSVILARDESHDGTVKVYVILDDVTFAVHEEHVAHYMSAMKRIINKVGKNIHVHTLKLSHYWDDVVEMSLDQIEKLRNGYAVYDVGFFEPMQQLLFQGRVKPSYESMGIYFIRAPETFKRAQGHVKQAIVDLYWAVMNASQAALMRHGELSPAPSQVADLMQHKFVRAKVLEPQYVTTVDKFYHLAKGIEHKEIVDVKGVDYDAYFKEAVGFVRRMRELMGIKI